MSEKYDDVPGIPIFSDDDGNSYVPIDEIIQNSRMSRDKILWHIEKEIADNIEQDNRQAELERAQLEHANYNDSLDEFHSRMFKNPPFFNPLTRDYEPIDTLEDRLEKIRLTRERAHRRHDVVLEDYAPTPEPLSNDIEPDEESDDLGANIDVRSPEICSLDAKAARNDLMDRLDEPDVLQNPWDPETFRDIVMDGDTPTLLRLTEADKRVSVALGSYKGLSVLAWLETHPQKGLLRQREHNSPEDIKYAPITVGVAVQGYNRTFFIPVLKSLKTPNGCYIVHPDDSEIDESTWNKPDILRLTKKIAATEDQFNPTDFGQLLQKVREAEAAHSELLALHSLIDRFVNDRAVKPVDTILPYLTQRIRTSATKQLLVEALPPAAVEVVGVQHNAQMHIQGEIHKAMYLLSVGDYTEEPYTGVRSRSFTLWGGLDPREYGNDEPIYPRYKFTHDELRGVKLEKFISGGMATEPADEKGLQLFMNRIKHMDFSADALSALL